MMMIVVAVGTALMIVVMVLRFEEMRVVVEDALQVEGVAVQAPCQDRHWPVPYGGFPPSG